MYHLDKKHKDKERLTISYSASRHGSFKVKDRKKVITTPKHNTPQDRRQRRISRVGHLVKGIVSQSAWNIILKKKLLFQDTECSFSNAQSTYHDDSRD
jgi:hypothetical protein